LKWEARVIAARRRHTLNPYTCLPLCAFALLREIISPPREIPFLSKRSPRTPFAKYRKAHIPPSRPANALPAEPPRLPNPAKPARSLLN